MFEYHFDNSLEVKLKGKMMKKVIFLLLLLSLTACSNTGSKPQLSTSDQDVPVAVAEKREGIHGDLVLQKSHNDTILAVDYAKNHDFFVTGSKDSTVKVWQRDGQLIRTIRAGIMPRYIELFEDDQFLILADNLGQVKVVNIEGDKYLSLPKTNPTVSDIDIIPSGAIYALGGTNGIQVFSIKGEQLLNLSMPAMKPTKRKTFKNAVNGVTTLALSDNGSIIAATNYYGELVVWNTKGDLLIHEKVSEAEITSIDFSSDGKLVLSLGYPVAQIPKDTNISLNTLVIDIPNGGKITDIKTPPMKKVIFSRDGGQLIGLTQAYNNKKVLIYDLNGKLKNDFTVGSGRYGPNDIAVSNDKNLVVVTDSKLDPSGITLWSSDGHLNKDIKHRLDSINDLVVSSDLEVVATGLHSNKVRLWSMYGKYLASLSTGSPVNALTFMPDNQTLIVGTNDNIQVWNTATNKRTQTLNGQKNGIADIDVAGEGFAAVGRGGKVQLFKLANGKYVEMDSLNAKDNDLDSENLITLGVREEMISFLQDRIIPNLSLEDSRANDLNGKYVFTNQEGIDHINDLKLDYKRIESFPDFRITVLNGTFLNKNTRAKELEMKYLIQVIE